ncbi:MAG: hypothetical protein GMKNLPBB_01392 [Myxococcota bacterium]|nr:hypothetical protein [Myxococcota bacterium]
MFPRLFMKSGAWIILSLAALAPGAAFAQNPPVAQGPRPQVMREVEKGFFMEADVGLLAGLTGNLNSVFPGMLAGVQLGYDITQYLSVDLGVTTMVLSGGTIPASNLIPSGELKQDQPQQLPRPDALALMPNLGLKFSYVYGKRVFAFIKAGGGALLADPQPVFGKSMVPGAYGGLGIEYYTNLRHFSVGLEARGYFMFGNQASVGLGFLPTLKYTF